MPVGGTIGSIMAGYLAGRFGRFKTFIFTDILAIIAGIINAIPYNATFGIGRVLSGVTVGIYSSVAPIYIAELSPPIISGRMGAMF